MGKVKNMLLDSFDMKFDRTSNDDLINTAYDLNALSQLDRGDMVALVQELGHRYQMALDSLQLMEDHWLKRN